MSQELKRVKINGTVGANVVAPGDVVGDPKRVWVQSTAEEYIDSEIEKVKNWVSNTPETNVVTVSSLPASGDVNTLYRVAGTNTYSEYGWDGTQFVKLDEKEYGIDDEPTAGSDNLVKSGGVEEEFDKLTSDGSLQLSSLTWQAGYFDASRDQIHYHDSYVASTDYIKGNRKYTINGNVNSHNIEVVWYDANKQWVSCQWFSNITEINATTHPYFRISLNDFTPETVINSGISLYCADNRGSITFLQDECNLISVNLENHSTSFCGLELKMGLVDNHGVVTSSNKRAYLDGVLDLTFDGVELGDNTRCYVYVLDENDNALGGNWRTSSFSAYDLYKTGAVKYRVIFAKTDDSVITSLNELIFKIRQVNDYKDLFEKLSGIDFGSEGYTSENKLIQLLVGQSAVFSYNICTYNISNGDVIDYYCAIDNLLLTDYSDIYVRFTYTLSDGSLQRKNMPLRGKAYSPENAVSVLIGLLFTATANIDKGARLIFISAKNPEQSIVESADYYAAYLDKNKHVVAGLNRDEQIEFEHPLTAPSIEVESVKSETINLPVEAYKGIGEKLEKVEAINDHGLFNDYVYTSDGYILRVFNPYKGKGSHLYMGELHCHSYGSSTPQTAEKDLASVNAYKNLGFDFMTFTNYQNITKKPEGATGIIWLCNSMEHQFDGWNNMTGEHLCLYNAAMKFEHFDNYPFPHTKMQDMLDWAKENNIITSIAHPMWNNISSLFQSKEKLETISRSCTFIEVYNSVVCETLSSGYPYNEYGLDVMLSKGLRIFGTAVSDSHAPTIIIDDGTPNAKTPGNVKVFANEKTRKAIWEALLSGQFIACTRTEATISDVRLEEDAFVVETEYPATITFIGLNGNVLKIETSVTSSSYSFLGDEKYVRARVSYGNGVEVYTQAIIVSSKMK